MPNDPYQIGDTDSGITLVLADRGTSVAVLHAASHVTGGSDKIRDATTSVDGLMTAAHALKLDGIAPNADVTSAAGIYTALNGVTSDTPEGADRLTFLDATGSALRNVTFTSFFDFLDDTFVRRTGDQSISGTKTFSSVVLTSATINGGTITGTALSMADAALFGQLPVAKGGTGLASYSVGSVLYASGATTLSGLAAVATGSVLISGGLATAPSWGKVGLTTHVSGILPTSYGGTGSNAGSTGSGGAVLNDTPTITTAVLVDPDLGTPTAGTLTYCDGLPLSTGVTGVLPVANGGTGFATRPYGQLSGQTASGVSFSDAGYLKRDLDTTLGSAVSGFSSDSVFGRLKYTGSETQNFCIFSSMDVLSSVAGANFSIKLYKYTDSTASGALINESQCNANGAGKSGSYLAKLVTSWIVSLAQNDWIELHVAAVSLDAGTPQRMRLIATPI